MGPRLGRVEYPALGNRLQFGNTRGFNGATLRTRGIPIQSGNAANPPYASMGPRLGRVEYRFTPIRVKTFILLQWGHA